VSDDAPEVPVLSPPRPFLTADWRWLVMLNYEVDPAALLAHVPLGAELDTWEGRTFVSLVGFRFLDTRVRGLAIPFHRDFEEINLRFYVRRRGPEGWRRGVVFVREIVPRRAIAAVARWLYGENYVARPMRSTIVPPERGPGEAEFGWRSGGDWLSFGARFEGSPTTPAAGSEEEFITEHYWGYSALRGGGTVEYRVEHVPWQVWPATASWTSGELAAFYPPEFGEALRGTCSSAFVAEGSPVAVHAGRRIHQAS